MVGWFFQGTYRPRLFLLPSIIFLHNMVRVIRENGMSEVKYSPKRWQVVMLTVEDLTLIGLASIATRYVLNSHVD